MTAEIAYSKMKQDQVFIGLVKKRFNTDDYSNRCYLSEKIEHQNSKLNDLFFELNNEQYDLLKEMIKTS